MLHRNEIQRWEMRYKDGVQKMLQDIDKPLWLTTKSQSKVIQIQSQKCKKKKKIISFSRASRVSCNTLQQENLNALVS